MIARLTAEWQADYDAWRNRDLSARRYVYVWADGVYLQARMENAMAVAIANVVRLARDGELGDPAEWRARVVGQFECGGVEG